jgi:hypothetical protein
VKLANTTIPRDEYLQAEIVSKMRHGYIAGHVYAMSGGKLNHQRIAGNFFYTTKRQLSGKTCFPTGNDFKLQIILGSGDEAFYYPNGMIICQPVAGDVSGTPETLSSLDAVLHLPEAGMSISLAELFDGVN